jgi:hypothetical protein
MSESVDVVAEMEGVATRANATTRSRALMSPFMAALQIEICFCSA